MYSPGVTGSLLPPALHHCAPADMQQEEKSCVFFPRQKAGDHSEPELLTRRININYETLEKLFHLPLKDAAREIGLCSTTFKKACRHFNMKKWPFRKGQSKTPPGKPGAYTRRNAQPNGVHAAITPHYEPIRPLAASKLQTTEVHQDNSAVAVSRTPSSSTVTASRTGSSATTVRASSAALDDRQSLLQQAAMAFDTRSCGEAGHAGAAFPLETFAPLDALSYIDSLTLSRHQGGDVFDTEESQEDCMGSQEDCMGSQEDSPRGSPILEGQASTLPCTSAPPPDLKEEQSCVEAVLEYLESSERFGSLGHRAGNFDFMFED